MKRFLLLALVVVAACGSEKPSDQEVRNAVGELLRAKGLASILRDEQCGRETGPLERLEKVETAEWGAWNEREGYLPVKVRVAGTCRAALYTCGNDKASLCPLETRSFELKEPLALALRKKDFGGWTAEVLP